MLRVSARYASRPVFAAVALSLRFGPLPTPCRPVGSTHDEPLALRPRSPAQDALTRLAVAQPSPPPTHRDAGPWAGGHPSTPPNRTPSPCACGYRSRRCRQRISSRTRCPPCRCCSAASPMDLYSSPTLPGALRPSSDGFIRSELPRRPLVLSPADRAQRHLAVNSAQKRRACLPAAPVTWLGQRRSSPQ